MNSYSPSSIKQKGPPFWEKELYFPKIPVILQVKHKFLIYINQKKKKYIYIYKLSNFKKVVIFAYKN